MRRERLAICCGLTIAATFLLICAGPTRAGAAEEVVTHRNVPYIDDGDARHKADVYVPPGEGPFPGVLMIHGGAWTMGNKAHMSAHARRVVQAGYTVISINYRLAPKYKFPAQLDDCKAAVRWLRANAKKYKIDPERIAAYGYSAGGHLACLLGTIDADKPAQGDDAAKNAPNARVQCVVAGGAPCEFRTLPKNLDTFDYWLGGTRGQKPDVYRLASPTAFATRDDPPVFFFHGEDDKLVPRASPKALQAALSARGVDCQFLLVAGKGHIGAFLDPRSAEEAVKFLDAHLKGQ